MQGSFQKIIINMFILIFNIIELVANYPPHNDNDEFSKDIKQGKAAHRLAKFAGIGTISNYEECRVDPLTCISLVLVTDSGHDL